MTDFKVSAPFEVVGDITLQDSDALIWGTDVKLFRDAANILAQRNGVNPQEWRLYERFVSLSDYDRVVMYIGGAPGLITFELEAQSTTANQAVDMVIVALNNNQGEGSVILKSDTAILTLRGPSGGSSLTLSGGGDLIASDDMVVGRRIRSVGISETTPGDGLVFDMSAVGLTDGNFRDSHKIIMRGRARSVSQGLREPEWRYFVDVLDDLGASTFTVQSKNPANQVVTDRLTISDAGNVTLPSGGLTVGGFLFVNSTSIFDATNTEAFLIRKNNDGGDVFTIDTTNDIIKLSSPAELRWGTDVKLFRDSANTLALRNGTTDQALKIYGTFTNLSNYERLAIFASGAGYFVEPQTAGTGNPNLALTLRAVGQGAMQIGHLGSQAVTLHAGNNFNFTTGQNQTNVSFSISDLNAQTPALSGATGVLGGFLPANSIIQSITFRVTTAITGATSFDIGDGTTVDRWGSGRPITLNSTTDVGDYTVDLGPFYTPASTTITFTAVGGNFTGGVIRAIVIYSRLDPPTS